MNVLLLLRMPPAERLAWREHLQHAAPSCRWLDEDEARAAPASIDAAVVANPRAGALQGWPRLRLIQSLWAGVDRLLADSTLPAEVPLARMVDPAMSQAMAETALWATLALQRGFFRYQQQQRQAQWLPQPQRRADEVRVLVLGHGEMGRCAARAIARQGFAVRAWRRNAGFDARDEGVTVVHGDLAPHLATAEVLINLLPLTAETTGLLDAQLFAQLPRGAGVVNLGRGAQLVDGDLLAALDRGQLGHAVLDVFVEEPLPPSHRFWQHPGVTVLPHVAAATDPRSAAQVVAANLAALAAGQPLAHLVRRERGY